ncbi:MAG: FadR family transcriptional regulator [Synergistaceae bacterium]|jgi:GntR family transcriptional repressor for pyruvate dehydrogenase complex|nr:FadR family transcriptional regulator [Synergistaceae bacterium]
MLKPANRSTVGDFVWDQFVELLNSGKYKLGEKLPPEAVMCDELKVSRPVLREVIRTLRYLGYLETVHGGGTYISKMPLNPTLSGIKLRLALEKQQLLDLWEIRNIIEVEATALAAERATDEEMQEILLASEEYHSKVVSKSTREETIKSTESFHYAIVAAVHNNILMSVLQDISNLLTHSRELSIQVEGSSERADEYHSVIAKAILSRDADEARKTMRAHLIDVRHDLERYLTKQEEKDEK